MTTPDPSTVGSVTAASPALALAAAAGDDLAARDRFIARAAVTGDSVATIADHLGLSRQQVHAILDAQRQTAGPQPDSGPPSPEDASAWRATEQALEALTSGEDFERLVQVLLLDIDDAVRPLGGTGDRARDAAADLRGGDESVFSISLERQWTRKIRREVARVLEFGHRPTFIYAVTNRRTTRAAERDLEHWAESREVTLRVLGQRWLVAKLMHPAYLELRREFLHLAPPRPAVFLDPTGYRRLLDGRPATQGLTIRRVGEEKLATAVRTRLDDRGCVVLHGPGGIGKTRLMLDVADAARPGEAWRFLDDLTPFRDDALGELGSGTDVVVVIDNAHRRRDIEDVLALLERRQPRPKVVFVVRPSRPDNVMQAAARVWLGALDDEDNLEARRLTNRDIKELVTGAPFELGYDGMIHAVVNLAEGNPLIAILAAGLARDGRSIAELSRGEVFAHYVSGLLANLTDRSSEPRQLRDLLAIAAALGSIDRADDVVIDTTAQLLGFARRAVHSWIDELADLGLVVESGNGLISIKPDLLAEHVLVASFFSERWRPALPYTEVLDAFADRYLAKLCAALGRVPHGELNPDHPGLVALRARLKPSVEGGDIPRAAKLLEELLPGGEDLVLDDLSHLIGRVEVDPSALSTDAGTILVRATQRLNVDVASGWDLLLRLTAATDDTEVLGAAREAMQSIYKRVPTRTSEHDGHILAMVQQVIAGRTQAYLRRARTPGQLRAAAMAGQALLTTTFELSEQAVDDARQIRLSAYALPASPYTETALDVGINAVTTTFLEVDDGERLRGLEAATELARRTAGFAGPFGIQLTDAARRMAHQVLGDLDRFLHVHLPELTLPLQAEALGYLLARREWYGRTEDGDEDAPAPPSLPAHSTDLDDYLLLVHPRDVEPPSDRLSWQEEQQAKHARATQIAERLLVDPGWRARLATWESWKQQAGVLSDQHGASHWPVVVFTEAAKVGAARTIEMIDHLVAIGADLRLQLAGAIHQLVATDQINTDTMERWLQGDETFRATIATAIGDLDSALAETTFRRLATDDSEVVRRGVLNGLRYGRSPLTWKIALGIEIARGLADIDALHTVLVAAELAGVELTPDLEERAAEALLAGAGTARIDEHDLVEVVRKLQPSAPGIALAWAWKRIEWLEEVESRAWKIDSMPSRLIQPIRECATPADLCAALARYEAADPGELAESALVELLNWIDPAAPEITEFIVRNIEDPTLDRKAHRLLRLDLTWEQARVRAAALVDALDDPALVASLARNMLPTFWSGSLVGHLETALENVTEWDDEAASPRFREGIVAASAELTRWIEGEKERERRQDEVDVW